MNVVVLYANTMDTIKRREGCIRICMPLATLKAVPYPKLGLEDPASNVILSD